MSSLVEAALAQSFVVQGNGNDAGRCVQRFSLRSAEEEID